jgi:hypothetical protein
MEHFRGATLMKHGQMVVEDVDGHLGHHVKSGGRKQWFGYFELRNNQHITAGEHYQLHLADGRQAEVNAADVPASEVPGRDVHVAEFYVVGDVTTARRGLGVVGKPRLG